MHAVRSARPKLSLAVPAATKPAVPALVIPTASGFSRPAALPAPSPLTPTARNTQFNARASSSLQVPAAAPRSLAKKHAKKVSFAAEQSVTIVSPCPQDYYGDYVKMSREERRWSRSN